MPTQDELLNTRVAAQRYSLSESYLNKKRCDGLGPPFLKLGRKVLYRASDLDSWILQQRRTSTSDPGPESGNEEVRKGAAGTTAMEST